MTDTTPADNRLLHPGDPGAAFMLLTRLPVPQSLSADRGARSAWVWPVIGGVIAVIAAGVGWTALTVGLPPEFSAGCALLAMIATTGALHEDGLADCSDGIWGARTTARRLEIMKDSRIGAFGAISLVVVLGLRWSALAGLFAMGAVLGPLLVAAAGSRAAMAVLSCTLPFARSDGFAAHVGRAPPATALVSVLLAAGIAFAASGWSALTVLLVVAAMASACAWVAQAKLGGQTGDVLGATQQITETAALAACLAIMV